MAEPTTLTFDTKGRGLHEITHALRQQLDSQHSGLCHLFIKHTSASLIITENADPRVLKDLDTFMNHLVPDGNAMFCHTAEGPDDMPAHVRSVLTQTSLTIPVIKGRLQLGTWQGVFVWEHRHQAHRRNVVVSFK